MESLKQANLRSSTKVNDEVMNQTAKDLLYELKNKFKGYGIREVSFAIYRGSTGQYGEFYGVNSKSVIGWLLKYRDNDRTEAMKEKTIVAEKERKQKELNEMKQLKKEFHNKVVDMYNDYKNTGKVMRGLSCQRWVVYEYLAKELGHDLIPIPEKNKIFDKAQIEMVKDWKEKKGEAEAKGDRTRLQKLINIIKEDQIGHTRRIAMGNSLVRLMDLMIETNVKLKTK